MIPRRVRQPFRLFGAHALFTREGDVYETLRRLGQRKASGPAVASMLPADGESRPRPLPQGLPLSGRGFGGAGLPAIQSPEVAATGLVRE